MIKPRTWLPKFQPGVTSGVQEAFRALVWKPGIGFKGSKDFHARAAASSKWQRKAGLLLKRLGL